jgi:hypothetical protein
VNRIALKALWVLVATLTCSHVHAQGPDPDKPWHIRFSLGGGYNSNAGARGDTITTAVFANPAGISGKESALGRFTFDASYDLLATDTDLITVGYGIHGDVYEGNLRETNLLAQNWWVGYQRLLREDLSFSLQLADELIHIGGSKFTNSVLLEPSIYYRANEWLAIQAGYTAQFIDLLAPIATPAVDRDGIMHKLGFTLFIDVPNTQLRLRLGYAHRWNRTDVSGGLYDFDGDEVSVGASYPLPLDVELDVSWSRRWEEYAGLGPTPGTVRDDTTDMVSVLLTRPINEYLTVYARFDYIDADSNATLFDYKQEVFATGVIIEF